MILNMHDVTLFFFNIIFKQLTMLDNRGRLTLCVIGDSSSGKSMTAGNLVYRLGKVQE